MMFLSSDAIHTVAPKLGPIMLSVTRDVALRSTQRLFLEGRQINALYICTPEEWQVADRRKQRWLASAHELLEKITVGCDVIDFFDEIALNVVQDSDPIERWAEQFHNEMNQRLERLRMTRRMIENSADPEKPANGAPKSPISAEGGESPLLSSVDPTNMDLSSLSSGAAPASPSVNKTKVLLILCSRNGTARQALCRFGAQMHLNLEIIDYNPENPSAIAEQIYHHRDAKFAIIYWGEPTGKELPGSAPPERYVGFALGFALGRLGRGRVFILGSTTTPPLPGFTRVLVAQLDSGGGWQIQLARRIKAAGVEIDLNKLT